jgi:hypothetical protein
MSIKDDAHLNARPQATRSLAELPTSGIGPYNAILYLPCEPVTGYL